jgi:hypothetical protein
MTQTQQLVRQLYKDEQGNPIDLSTGQDILFQTIFAKLHPRNHVMTHTRYGKSMTTALAVLTRCATYPERWAIVAGQKDKARIIIDHVINHIFDNDYTKSRFIPEKGEDMETIRRYKNKNRLTFKTDVTKEGKTLLSEIFIGSAKDALGFGAANVVEDESALIPDDEHAFVMRMLGDNPKENFLVKIGNPFNRNHFLRSAVDPNYHKFVVDCYDSLKEGRITQDVITEMRQFAFFKVLYECDFPSEGEIDEEGWLNLLVEDDINIAQNRTIQPYGIPRLGVDVAKGGRNFNCWVLRGDNYAKVLRKDHEEDSVKIADQTYKLMLEHGVIDRAVFVDDTGVGHGVVSILKNRNIKVNAVNFAEHDFIEKQHLNLRAQVYAGPKGVQAWVKGGAKLEPYDGWKELTKVRYKKQERSGRTMIESKDDMRKRGIESPDVADALALTFAKTNIMAYTISNALQSLSEYRPFGGIKPYAGGVDYGTTYAES